MNFYKKELVMTKVIKKDTMRVKRRLLFPILLALISLTALSVVLFYHVMDRHLDVDTEEHLSGVRHAFEDHVKANMVSMQMQLELLVRNQQLQENWLEEDRESLLRNTSPLFESMRKVGVSSFFIVRPDKTIFLRVDKPEEHGDTVSTFSIDRSVKDGLFVSGIETCAMWGTPIQQAVMPWRIDGKVTGFMGINRNMDQFAIHLQEEFGIDLLVAAIKKNPVVPRPVSIPWPKESSLVPVFSSIDTLSASSSFRDIEQFLVKAGKPFADIAIGEKKYRVMSFPLVNAAGEEIARIAMLDDITDIASFLQLMLKMLVVLLVAGGGVFAFFVWYLGRIEKNILAKRTLLQDEITAHKNTAEELQILKEKLEEKVAEQTRALTEANNELWQKVGQIERAREKVRVAFNELEQIFQANSTGMRVVDSEHRVIRANKSYLKLVGLSLDEVVGNQCFENFTCPHANTPHCCVRQVLAGKDYVESECEIIRQNGTSAWVFHTSAPFWDTNGQLVGIVQDFQDITIRKEAELSVLKASEQWEKTFDAMPDIVTIHDTKMHLIRANKAAAEILNQPIEQLIGKTCYNVFRGKDSPCEGCPEAVAMHDYQVHAAEIEHPNLNKTFMVSASPIVDDQGVCTGIVHLAKDITEHKRLEAKLSQAQKMEAIGTLAGGIAHDFNNILSVIFGYTNFALEDTEKGSQKYEDLKNVLTASDRAKDLVQQILTFSRQNKAAKAPLLLAPIINEALKFLRSTLPTSIDIRWKMSASKAMILADPTQVYQVLMNLCINASHAMDKEGGMLEVELAEKMVDAEESAEHPTLRPGRYMALRVSDTGDGIDPALIEKIFDPFFTTKEKGKGTGLGLAVVHGIVMDHGGDITVHSRPGEGTTFLVLFPEIELEESKVEIPESKLLAGGNERILVVDDEKALAQMLRRILESFGYEVVVQTSSIDALELFQASPDSFDLVITDQTMPQMKGIKLAGELLNVRPDIPIILCSGYSEEIDEEYVQSVGIQAVLRKPVINSELSKTIRKALEG